MLRLAMKVLWPSFLAAVLAEGCFFSLFDPQDLIHARDLALAPGTLYTLGFFAFWAFGTLASILTYYLVTVPDDPHPPF